MKEMSLRVIFIEIFLRDCYVFNFNCDKNNSATHTSATLLVTPVQLLVNGSI